MKPGVEHGNYAYPQKPPAKARLRDAINQRNHQKDNAILELYKQVLACRTKAKGKEKKQLKDLEHEILSNLGYPLRARAERWRAFWETEKRPGRPSAVDADTKARAQRELEFKEKNPHKTWEETRDALYPNRGMEVDAIKQRVRRLKKSLASRKGLPLK